MSRSRICESDHLRRVFSGHRAAPSLEDEHPNQHSDNNRRPNHQPVAHGGILAILV